MSSFSYVPGQILTRTGFGDTHLKARIFDGELCMGYAVNEHTMALWYDLGKLIEYILETRDHVDYSR